jgi:predicted AAA+ superfamily ATPase
MTAQSNGITIKWTRGKDEIRYTRPDMYFCLGMRGSGKSTFLETTAEGFLHAGNGVLDLFGST